MTEKPGIRRICLDTLLEFENTGEKAGDLIRRTLDRLEDASKSERAFFTRVTSGTIEQMIMLDTVIECYSTITVRKMKPAIRNILRMSLYQILEMKSVPDSAAVDEAVKLTKAKGYAQLSGFVNGVLRSIIREPEKTALPEKDDIKKYISVKYSMPEFLVDEWIGYYGKEKTEDICAFFLEDRPLSVRLRGRGMHEEDILKSLEDEGITAEKAPYPDGAYFIKDYDRVESIRTFKEGNLYVQDINAQLCGVLTGVGYKDRVLDMCAAPGGKSLCMAHMMKNSGEIIARDVSEKKVALIEENVLRCRMDCIKPEVRDALLPDPENEGAFDVVVVDAPCSGYGVIGKKPDIKYGASEEKEDSLIKTQRDILHNAASLVKEEGTLVYMTCTFNRRENEENAQWFARNHDFYIEDITPYLPEGSGLEANDDGTLTLLPGSGGGDGFFIARFKKWT